MRKRMLYLMLAGALLIGAAACTSDPGDPAEREAGGRAGQGAGQDTTAAALDALQARVDSLEALVDSVLAAGQADPRMEPATPEGSSSPAGSPGGATSPRERVATPQPAARAGAPARPEEIAYETYHNERVGFSIDYPANVLHPGDELFDGAGRKFVSEDGRTVLVVFGMEAESPQALERLFQEELNDEDARVTYQTRHDDWFVISGYVGEQVFYERAIQRGNVLKVFLLLYDEAEKSYFDPITERISFSFEG